MNRALAILVMLMCAVSAPVAPAQERIYRIGYIVTATPGEQEHLTRALRGGLEELGYVEGRNVMFEQRFADGAQERLPGLAADLVRLKVDVIVTGGNPVIAAVVRATNSIPVVMAASRDPVVSGFVADLARPGGNVTGLTNDPTPAILSKNLALLKEAVPALSRVAVLWNPRPPGATAYLEMVASSARELGLSVLAVEARGRDEFEAAFSAIVQGRADAVVVLPDPIFFTARHQVVELAAKHRVPAIYHAREFVEIGGLMSYGSNLVHQFRRAAVYVDKILRGANPGELPVEQPTRLEFVINVKAADALGFAIAPTLLARADEVIE